MDAETKDNSAIEARFAEVFRHLGLRFQLQTLDAAGQVLVTDARDGGM